MKIQDCETKHIYQVTRTGQSVTIFDLTANVSIPEDTTKGKRLVRFLDKNRTKALAKRFIEVN